MTTPTKRSQGLLTLPEQREAQVLALLAHGRPLLTTYGKLAAAMGWDIKTARAVVRRLATREAVIAQARRGRNGGGLTLTLGPSDAELSAVLSAMYEHGEGVTPGIIAERTALSGVRVKVAMDCLLRWTLIDESYSITPQGVEWLSLHQPIAKEGASCDPVS